MKTIIVDDNDESRYLLEAMLKANGHDAVSAENGAEAFEKLMAERFDLIISDILMPVMDGFQLCRKVKADDTLRDIPFVIYTATYTGPEDEAFAVKIGADRFIQKPCEPDVFMEAIGEVTASKERQKSSSESGEAGEEEVLKLYSQRLVRNLEQKMKQLEQEVATRKEAEEKLAQSEKQYRLLAENMLDVIWAMTPDLTFTYVNEAVQGLLGYSPQEWIGARLRDHCDKENFEKMTRAVEKEIARGPAGTGTILEAVLLHRDGSEVPVEIHGRVVFDEENAPVLLQGITRDISERRRAEREHERMSARLVQAQKLESIGTLAGGIAHDFNNILSSIIGYTELALNEVEKGTGVYQDLVQVCKAGERAKKLTRQILNISRRQPHAKGPLRINPLAEEALKMLRSTIPASIEIHEHISAEPLTVFADSTQIHQVIVNLVTNAMHAMTERNGIIEVCIEPVEFDGESLGKYPDAAPGEYVCLTVSDNGEGIAADHLDKIFEPYFTTKEKEEGTGLGLSVVHGIVKAHEGHVTVYSEPGRGTAFHVYLPLVRKSADSGTSLPKKGSL
ncbi:MAG: response regulator, partial [Desulfarculaceae bacterium]|nr:response regulator [Desulfarculaceae bacterium]